MGACCCISNNDPIDYSRLEDGSHPKSSKSSLKRKKDGKSMSFCELMMILKPYFWPSAGSDGACLNRLRALSTWILVGLSKATSLLAPLYLAIATNYLLDDHLKESFLNIIFYCVLRLSSSIFKELQGIVYLKVKQQASIQLAEETFTHLHSLSLSWHLNKKMGNVVRSMDRGTDAANDLVSAIFLYLGPTLGECIAACVIFYARFNDYYISVVVFSGVMLYCIATVILAQWRTKVRAAANVHDNKYHEKATDSIINYETVKYFTAEEFEVKRFKESVIDFQRLNVTTQVSLGILNITQQFILNVTVVFALILSCISVHQGNMNLGEFVAVNTYIATLFTPLNYLGTIYSTIIKGLVDVANLSQLLSEAPDVIDLPGAKALILPKSVVVGVKKFMSQSCPKCNMKLALHWKFCPQCSSQVAVATGSINGGLKSKDFNSGQAGLNVEFKGIFFHYPEQPAVKGLKNVNFQVPAGSTVAIVGHTGAGKTTISRLLFRFFDPLQGSVEIGGQDIKHCTQKSVRAAIGIVPQDTVLFNDTILHNIQYGRLDATRAEIEAAADAAQIRSFIESLPQGWDTPVGERGLKLSGGEKQRVAIARCLLKDPPIVLLDEATSALDTATEQSIQDALAVLGEHRTVLIIAHRLSTIRNANQIIVMDEGEVVERGTHEELLAIKNGYYSRLWNMQLRDPDATASVSSNLLGSEESKKELQSPTSSINGKGN